MKIIKSGFTLVEMLIVLAILAVLVLVLIGILNPIGLINKANDARRKKDIARMKVALEEYMNDKGCYPSQDSLATCGKDQATMKLWLNPWPCDPKGMPYMIVVDPSTCAKWFKIMTNLDNKTDRDIPSGWYTTKKDYIFTGKTTSEANFGVSSSNMDWTDEVPASCGSGCSWNPNLPAAGCNATWSCAGVNCYRGQVCSTLCRVNKCP